MEEYDAYTFHGFVNGNRNQGDFYLDKNVLRRVLVPGYRPKIWIQGTKFLINHETKQILVKGTIWYEVFDDDNTSKKVFTLQNIEKFDDEVLNRF